MMKVCFTVVCMCRSWLFSIHSHIANCFKYKCSYRVRGTFGGDFNLAVILIWRLGRFSSYHQIKITANTVVLSQVLINSNDERAYPPN